MRLSKLKLVLFFLLIVTAISKRSYGQNIELIGGFNQNNFYDREYDGGPYHSAYDSQISFCIRLGVENIKIDWLTMRITAGYEKYGGELEVRSGGQGGSQTIMADVEKSIISLGLFPVNIKILKRIGVNAGFELGRLLNEKYQGTLSGWALGEPISGPRDSWSYDLQEKYDKFSSKSYVGLRVRVAYDFNITESIILSPQYSFYRGLSNEFGNFPQAVKSMRHYLSIGLEKKLK